MSTWVDSKRRASGDRPSGSRWTRRTAMLVAGPAVIVGLAILVAALAGAFDGPNRHARSHSPRVARTGTGARHAAVAGAPATGGATGARSTGGSIAARGAHRASSPSVSHKAVVYEPRDPEESRSAPAPASLQHAAAAAPSQLVVAHGAASNAEVEQELKEMSAAEHSPPATSGTLSVEPGGDSVAGNGTVPVPAGVPAVIARVIAGANEIADFPYRYGGGHASFIDDAYDCSGSVSYALAAGGLLSAPETSGQLESWGVPGPGKYITVYANAVHTYMYVDGLLYDTAGRVGVYSSRWQVDPVDNAGYVVRHWPGL